MNKTSGASGSVPKQVSGSSGQSETKPEGIVPVVIRQITSSTSDNFQLFGMSFGMVSIVGIVRSIEHASAKINVTIEDHSGQIDAHLWLEDGDLGNMPTLLLNTYVRVIGSIRNESGSKTLMIFKIEPLSSINGLTTHLLEVANARYMAENFAGESSTHSLSSQAHQGTNSGNDTSYGGNAVKLHFGSNGKHLMVHEAVKGNKNEEGITKQELQLKFWDVEKDELEKTIRDLEVEGYIYTTVDSEHWLPTDIE